MTETEERQCANEILIRSLMDNPIIQKPLNEMKNYDMYTYEHMVSVALDSVALGRNLGYTEEELRDIGIAAILHDIGKLDIPLEILNKPARLTQDEFEIMKKHAEYSAKRVEDLGFPSHIVTAIRCHHENLDGTGYMDKLSGAEVPDISAIIRITDSYNAITDKRPYKDAETHLKAFQELCQKCGTWYKADQLEEFFALEHKNRNIS